MEKQLLLVLPKHTSAGQSAGGGGPENAHSCPQAVFGQLHEPRGGTTGLAHPTPQSAGPLTSRTTEAGTAAVPLCTCPQQGPRGDPFGPQHQSGVG